MVFVQVLFGFCCCCSCSWLLYLHVAILCFFAPLAGRNPSLRVLVDFLRSSNRMRGKPGVGGAARNGVCLFLLLGFGPTTCASRKLMQTTAAPATSDPPHMSFPYGTFYINRPPTQASCREYKTCSRNFEAQQVAPASVLAIGSAAGAFLDALIHVTGSSANEMSFVHVH